MNTNNQLRNWDGYSSRGQANNHFDLEYIYTVDLVKKEITYKEL